MFKQIGRKNKHKYLNIKQYSQSYNKRRYRYRILNIRLKSVR